MALDVMHLYKTTLQFTVNSGNATGTAVIVEPTLRSVKDAIQHAKQCGDPEWRAVVPFAPGKTDPERLSFPYAVVYPDVVDHSKPLELVPWNTQELHRFCATLEQNLLLRRVENGISQLQEHLLLLYSKGLAEDEICGACVARYRLPISTVRRQWEQLASGARPILQHLDSWQHVPHALVNGPVPFAVNEVADYIRARLFANNYSFLVVPVQPGWTFERIGESNDWVGTRASEITQTQLFRWEPEFLDGDFSPSEYVNVWIELRLVFLYTARLALLDQHRFLIQKRRFIRAICVDTETRADRGCFFQASRQAKQQRIQEEYDNQQSLLDLKIGELEQHSNWDPLFKVPESPRDMLILELAGL